MASVRREWIAEVDAEDRVVGRMTRDSKPPGAGFRVVHVLIRNRAGHLLLQRIAPDRPSMFAGRWGSSAAGHVRLGETYEAAAVRELNEELGVTSRLTFLGRVRLAEGNSQKFIGVYVGSSDGPFHPDPAEISEVRFWSPAEIMAGAEGGHIFSGTFTHLLRTYPHLLTGGTTADGSY